MINIFDSNAAFVYGYTDIETKKLNIGVKTSNGSDKLTYITSLESPEFWERYSKGMMERKILFVGSVDAARTAEWFALDYGMATQKGRFYNQKNNAHCVDESLLSVNDKQIIIDFINGVGEGIEYGSEDSHIAGKNKEIVRSIAHRIENGEFEVHSMPTTVVNKYKRIQVREELVDQSTVSKIRSRMLEDPVEARKTLSPISVVVSKNGDKYVVNGNTRLAAASKTPGWDDVPVVFINESEFGSTEKIREHNYVAFGLYMNKEDFEIRVPNTKETLKRNISNFLVSENIDLSNQLHVDRARHLIYENFDFVCGTKAQLNGIFASIRSDFERENAELRYQDNLLTYDEQFFKNYSWNKYGKNEIATVHASVGEAANAKPLAYICRVMKSKGATKGAIILHYTSKKEFATEEKTNWIQDLKDTINYMKLPIVVDVLPAFSQGQ